MAENRWRKGNQLKNVFLGNSISSDSDSSSDEEPKNGHRKLELLRKVADGRKKLKPIQPEQKTNRKDSNIQPPPRKKFCQHYSRDMEMLDDREPRNFKGSTNISKRAQPARGKKNPDFKEILEKINYHSDQNVSSSSSEDDNSTGSEEDYECENGDSDKDLNEDVPRNVEFDEFSKTTTPSPIQQIEPSSPASLKSRNLEEVEEPKHFVNYKDYMELYEKKKLLSEAIEVIWVTANDDSA